MIRISGTRIARTIFGSYLTEETGEPFYVTSRSRWIKDKDEKRFPLWLNEPELLWREKMIPIHLLRPDSEAYAAAEKWAKQAASSNTDTMLEIMKNCTLYRQLFAKFNSPFLSRASTTK